MRIISPLSPKAYLTAMKQQMSGHFELGAERFTGFFLGNWFHVTHHSGYNWNERYTNQKNAAMGYVRKTDEGCEVRFATFKGALCPAQFLFFLCFGVLYCLIMFVLNGITDPGTLWSSIPIGTGCILLAAPIGTLFESMTDRSEEGRRILLAFLIDPTDPFSYLNNKNQIP